MKLCFINFSERLLMGQQKELRRFCSQDGWVTTCGGANCFAWR